MCAAHRVGLAYRATVVGAALAGQNILARVAVLQGYVCNYLIEIHTDIDIILVAVQMVQVACTAYTAASTMPCTVCNPMCPDSI